MVQELKAPKAAQVKERLGSAIWQDTGYVLTSSVGTPLDPRNVAKRFSSACRTARIGKWHPHELRHTAASLMLANGVPLQMVSDILGHASTRITSDVYGHGLAPYRQEAAATMASFFAA
jgi:integrase